VVLFAGVTVPAVAQSSESAPAAAAPTKSKPKTPAGSVTVKVTNWRNADLLELQATRSGSSNWKKVLGALKAGQWTWAKVPQGIVGWICAGNTPMGSPQMRPMSMSVRTSQST
jgi:hypothetical protein